MSRQLTFDLAARAALGAEDFFVSASNRAARDMVLGTSASTGPWPGGKLALIGPAGSGKTHLVHVWAAREGAHILPADSISALPRPDPGAKIVIEDLEGLGPADEEQLFHLHNHLAATGGRLLLTARRPPARWPIALPDLASRMQATTPVEIGDPDDALLFAVLAKLFADRQIAPEPGLIPWLVLRIERSFAAARAAVERLDAAALAEGRDVTRAFARAVLDAGSPLDKGARGET